MKVTHSFLSVLTQMDAPGIGNFEWINPKQQVALLDLLRYLILTLAPHQSIRASFQILVYARNNGCLVIVWVCPRSLRRRDGDGYDTDALGVAWFEWS